VSLLKVLAVTLYARLIKLWVKVNPGCTSYCADGREVEGDMILFLIGLIGLIASNMFCVWIKLVAADVSFAYPMCFYAPGSNLFSMKS
jgi:hypothetical protein